MKLLIPAVAVGPPTLNSIIEREDMVELKYQRFRSYFDNSGSVDTQ